MPMFRVFFVMQLAKVRREDPLAFGDKTESTTEAAGVDSSKQSHRFRELSEEFDEQLSCQSDLTNLSDRDTSPRSKSVTSDIGTPVCVCVWKVKVVQ